MNNIAEIKEWLQAQAEYNDNMELSYLRHRIAHGIPEEGPQEKNYRIAKTYFNDCLSIVEAYETAQEELNKAQSKILSMQWIIDHSNNGF